MSTWSEDSFNPYDPSDNPDAGALLEALSMRRFEEDHGQRFEEDRRRRVAKLEELDVDELLNRLVRCNQIVDRATAMYERQRLARHAVRAAEEDLACLQGVLRLATDRQPPRRARFRPWRRASGDSHRTVLDARRVARIEADCVACERRAMVWRAESSHDVSGIVADACAQHALITNVLTARRQATEPRRGVGEGTVVHGGHV